MITAAGSTPPTANPRPATVTVAFGLQLGVAAVLLTFLALDVVEAVVYDGLIDQAAELTRADPEEVSGERGSNVTWAAMTAVPAVALLALFAATAFPVRSGSNVARILTCVGAGFPLLCGVACGGTGILALPLLALEETPPPGEDPYWPEDTPFYESLFDLQSKGLANVLSVALPGLLVVVFVLSVAVAVLLLVPPSNRYYRPPQPPPAPRYPFAYPVPPGYVLVPITPLPPGGTIPGPAGPTDSPTDT